MQRVRWIPEGNEEANMTIWQLSLGACLLVCMLTDRAVGARLVDVLPIDGQCLVVHWQDGAVHYKGDAPGDSREGRRDREDEYIPYGKPLDVVGAKRRESFRVSCLDDANYGADGKPPVKVHRKSKAWEASFRAWKPAMHHWIYLELPSPLERGKSYTLAIDEGTNTDRKEIGIVFDEFALESPSIKISNLGYETSAVHKTADVYAWMGDGEGRDFSRLTGTTWHLYDVKAKRSVHSGKLRFYMAHRVEPWFGKDFTKADVWECDFSAFRTPGQYRLVVEGLGCSPVFTIGDRLFEEAFKVAMQGMFYQRMGCEEKPVGGLPCTRRPLYKQGVEPEGLVVYVSNRNMVTGRNPDDLKWYAADSTDRVVKETWGGWADAYDNDQRPPNFVCVFDLLLTYYLSPSSFSDGQLHVTESEANNGIPDIIDEALWEIDWWLRMRDPQDGGYLTGLCNLMPHKKTLANYAGAACAWQGWCVSAGCAMVADCFRLGGLPELRQKYTDAAFEAYAWASKQADAMLDTEVSGLRGRDLKMAAAAFLFNLTGAKEYEEVVKSESVAPSSPIRNGGQWQQQYASIAYMLSPQEVSYPKLQAGMEAAAIRQARADHVDQMAKSQTKAARAATRWEGTCQTSNEMSMVAIAHRVTDDPEDRRAFERALYSEAEWTLGRNPLGLVQMTGLTDRAVTQVFAPRRRDGVPGLTPGWTPYMCLHGWKDSDDIFRCSWYTKRSYPTNKKAWPFGEHFWNSRYCVPNSEATPQQNFRQKVVLYGYLYALGRAAAATDGPVGKPREAVVGGGRPCR